MQYIHFRYIYAIGKLTNLLTINKIVVIFPKLFSLHFHYWQRMLHA